MTEFNSPFSSPASPSHPQSINSSNIFIPTDLKPTNSGSSGGNRMSDLPVKSISAGALVLLLMIGGGMYAMSIRNSSQNLQKRIRDRNEEIAQVLEEEPGLDFVGKAQAVYENPLDEQTSYTNPFEEEEYQNPFAE